LKVFSKIKSLLLFGFLFIGIFEELKAQNNRSDCAGALKICGDGSISSNASGFGTQELNGLNNCASFEHNSLWLEIEITKAGTLGFDLIPSSLNIQIDYDFFIFGPNVTCGNLGFAVRCSTTNPLASGSLNNHTGMNDIETETSEGPGKNGNNYIRSLDVLPGETYFIVIDRPIGNSSFDLKWTGTATIGEFPFPDGPEINKPEDLNLCNSSGTATFNLSQNNASISSQNNTSLTYHESLANASDNINAIQGNYTSSQPVKTIYARVENNLTGCAKITDFKLLIADGPIIQNNIKIEQCDINNIGYLDFILSNSSSEILNGLNPSDYQIEYFNDRTEAEMGINAVSSNYNSEGDEIVFAKVWENGNPNCYNITEIELIKNAPPVIENFSLVQPQINGNNNSITLDIPNAANFEFAIGTIEGPYQTSTTFTNISSGFQNLYIKDLKGCAIISSKIAVIGYDNFFTPNNDGIHDFWQIKGITSDTSFKNLVYIFDRYGKLLKTLDASETGWNGEHNGKPMPADDYWFRSKLKNGQEFSGHFTLIR